MQNFDIAKEYILEDNRVLLRPLKATDGEHLRELALRSRRKINP